MGRTGRSGRPHRHDIQDRLATICNELGIRYIDLVPATRDAFRSTGDRLYYSTDRHLTPAGNRLVAELLRPELSRLLAQPPSPAREDGDRR